MPVLKLVCNEMEKCNDRFSSVPRSSDDFVVTGGLPCATDMRNLPPHLVEVVTTKVSMEEDVEPVAQGVTKWVEHKMVGHSKTTNH